MLNSSKTIYGWKNSQEQLKKNKTGIPRPYLTTYTIVLNRIIKNFKELIDDIYLNNGRSFKLPMDLKLLENYLSGFIIEYVGFESPLKGIEGYCDFDDIAENKITIYYDTNMPLVAQKFIKAHELFHIIQYLDPELRYYFDVLISETIMPRNIIQKLIDRSADKGAAMFLMPNSYVAVKYKEVKSLEETANFFQVSKEAMFWRLKECGEII